MSSWARKMATSSASAGGSFMTRHGKYTLVVIECSERCDKEDKEALARGVRPGHKGESVAVRFRVLESAKNGLSGDIAPHEAGDALSCVFNFSTQKDMAGPNLKKLLLGLTGKNEAEVSDDQMEAVGKKMCEKEQPFLGTIVKCETFEFTSKKGTKGVGQNWQHVPQTREQRAESRKQILGA